MQLLQDYSSFGEGQGLQGPTIPFLLLFIKIILQSLPDIVIHENVVQMPEEIIIKLLERSGLSMDHSLDLSYLLISCTKMISCFV